MGPLNGVRVLDLTWALSGPYSTMILADLGAEVLKIEIPEKGDFARQNGPFIEDVSAYFLSVNRGKKSLTLNLKSPQDHATFLKLVALSDVVIENFRPGTMERLGLDYDVLKSHNPAIVYAACSGFGKDSPNATRGAYDIIVQAMAGTMSINGQPDGPPTRVGMSIGDIAGGLFSAMAILAALLEREKSGLGQSIEVSMFDAQLALLENAFARYFATGKVPRPQGSWHPAIATFGVYQTSDTYIAMAAATDNQWRMLCEALGCSELVAEERFSTNKLRNDSREELNAIISKVFRGRTTEAWLALLEKADVPCGPVNDIRQVVEGDQFQSSAMKTSVKHPRLGELNVLGSPMCFSRTPVEISSASPDLGQDTDEVLSELLGMEHYYVGKSNMKDLE